MDLADVMKQLLEYTFAVSAALALVNMAPVYGLDGAAALILLLDMFSLGSSLSITRAKDQASWTFSCKLFYRATVFIVTSIFGLLVSVNLLRALGYDSILLRLLAAFRHILTFTVGLR